MSSETPASMPDTTTMLDAPKDVSSNVNSRVSSLPNSTQVLGKQDDQVEFTSKKSNGGGKPGPSKLTNRNTPTAMNKHKHDSASVSSINTPEVRDKSVHESELNLSASTSTIVRSTSPLTSLDDPTSTIQADSANNINNITNIAPSEVSTATVTAPIIPVQQAVTSSSGTGITTPITSGEFKVPKKIVLPENRLQTSHSEVSNANSIPAINRTSITELNKALKVKQKLISNANNNPNINSNNSNIKDHQISHKSSDIVNLVLQISNSEGSTVTSPGDIDLGPSPLSTAGVPAQSTDLLKTKEKLKKKSNNSTRADFFAAKLASAVDDVESSDSDETFVYEDNGGSKSNNGGNQPVGLAPVTPGAAPGSVVVLGLPRLEAVSGVSVSNHGSVINAPGIIPSTSLQQEDSMNLNSVKNLNEVRSENLLMRSVKLHSKNQANQPPGTSTATAIIPPSLTGKSDASVLSPLANSSGSGSGLRDNVTTISGKERPLSQRLNSIYSIVYSLLQFHDSDSNAGGVLSSGPIGTSTVPASGSVSIADSPNGSVIVGTTHLANSDAHPGQQLPLSLFDKPNNNQHQNPSPSAGTSIHDDGYTNDDGYSVVDVDDEGDGYLDLDNYADGDVTLKSHQSNQQNPSTNGQNPSLTEDGKTYKKKPKSSVTSSSLKLRSTTSKLFDKRGSQPRRYSIIPDDIDIEDFDDELIYYDNHFRFPYSNNSIGGGGTGQPSEHTSLLNLSGGRIPHYKSLNLNSINDKRQNLKAKRYLSTGYPNRAAVTNSNTPGQSSETNGNGNNNGGNQHNPDIFPFPYPDPQQPYYYDFDEFDEDSQSESDRLLHLNQKGNVQGNFTYPQLSSSNGHFILPRKRSSTVQLRTRINCLKSFIYTFIGILFILCIGFVMGFVLATTKELTHVNISSVENTLVSQDELMFNIVVEALNPGWLSIEIKEVELDIFAKSGYLPDDGDDGESGAHSVLSTAVETVLLGSVYNLETPLEFKGGLFSRDPMRDLGEIKLISPGKNISMSAHQILSEDKKKHNGTKPEPEPEPEPNPNPDNSKKWEIISKNPFDLIIRGVLKYKLPFNNNFRSVIVKKTAYVDPTVN